MDLRNGIIETARAIGANPHDLATVISYETGGTFDPVQAGPTTQWGQHRGLIQFGEPQAQQHGVDWDDPLGSQLGPNGAVANYLKSSGFKPGMGLLDLYSTVNAGAPGRYNASDANNGGAPGNVRDKVTSQMEGHRRKAAELLGTVSTQGQTETPMQQQEKPRGLLGQMFPNAKEGGLDQVALGLMSMSSNPTPGMVAQMRGIQGRMADQRDEKKASAQANKTAEYIRTQLNRPDLAQAVEQGIMTGADAYKIANAPQRDKGVNIDGRLVNPYTGEVMAEFEDQGDLSAREQRIQRGVDVLGLSLEDATKHADGMIEIITNPNSGDTMLYDKVTQQTRRIDMPERRGATDTVEVGEIGNVEGALGGRGIANSIANAAADAAGFNLPAEKAEQAASNLTNLSTQTMLALSGEWAGRPSNLTRERIEALTVKPNELFTGKSRALIRFREMQQLINQSIQSAEAVAQGDYSPAQRQQAQQKLQTLRPLSQEYGAIVQQLEGGGSGSGKTSSGIEWSIEE